MTGDSDLDFDRLRGRRLDRRHAPRRPPVADSPAFVGKVASPTSKIAVGKFLLVNPTDVLGAEVEGGAGNLTSSAATVPAYLVGPRVPKPGDYLVTRFVDHRWVVEYTGGSGGGGTGVTTPSCGCPITPTTIHISVSLPANLYPSRDCDPANYALYQSMVLNYVPPGSTPPDYVSAAAAAGRIPNGLWISQLYHRDSPIAGEQYFYTISCLVNYYVLAYYIYTKSPSGDGSLVWQGGYQLWEWRVGATGNACTPWLMASTIAQSSNGSGSGYQMCGGQVIAS